LIFKTSKALSLTFFAKDYRKSIVFSLTLITFNPKSILNHL
jgi:hypothetical protein